MSSNIVIVESPAKAKTIEKYLGKDFKVLASYGHVRDLVPKEGAVDPESGYAMRYEVIEKNEKHVAAIEKALKKGSLEAAFRLSMCHVFPLGAVFEQDLEKAVDLALDRSGNGAHRRANLLSRQCRSLTCNPSNELVRGNHHDPAYRMAQRHSSDKPLDVACGRRANAAV